MKTISIKELHERTGAWVRKAVELGAITVTDRGKPLVRLEAVPDAKALNPFRTRRLRTGYARLAFDASAFREVMAQFTDDCQQGLWTWLPLTFALAAKAAAAFARLPRPVFLQAADALHLICAQEHGLREIYTNDRHMSLAAPHFRLKPVTAQRA
jgi:predicted nucleic acid-binding protein